MSDPKHAHSWERRPKVFREFWPWAEWVALSFRAGEPITGSENTYMFSPAWFWPQITRQKYPTQYDGFGITCGLADIQRFTEFVKRKFTILESMEAKLCK